jgi:hypothetical protein
MCAMFLRHGQSCCSEVLLLSHGFSISIKFPTLACNKCYSAMLFVDWVGFSKDMIF